MPERLPVAAADTVLRPTASLSLDLDNLWSYLKTHGDAGWTARPTYLPRFLPLVLEALNELRLSITFFIVGADAMRDENADALRSVVTGGHETGNHSFEHDPWLHRYAPEQLEAEIARAEGAIEIATGMRPTGFRGPGYSFSTTLLEVLARRRYQFDASTLPTFVGPLARAYYFATARLTPPQQLERAELFGSWTNAFWPNKPYAWALPSGRQLLEIPVTVFPGLRAPFHLSYLLYLKRHSEPLALAYLRSALAVCRATGTEPSVLLHPLDLLGADVAPELRFFPGMDLATRDKRRFFIRALSILRDHFDVVPMSVHAARIHDRGAVRTRAAKPAPLTPSLVRG